MDYCRFLIPLLLALVSLACSSNEVKPVQRSPVFDYLHRKAAQGLSFSPDDTRVLYADRMGEKTRLYRLATDPTVEDIRLPLPNGELGIYTYFPKDSRILVSAQGPEMSGKHLFVQSLDGGFEDVTPGERVSVEFYAWGANAEGWFYGSNRFNRRFMYLHWMDADSFSNEVALQTQDLQFAAASEDARYLALVKPISVLQSEMLYYDRETKKLHRLTPIGGDQLAMPQYFEPGGTSFVYLTNEETGIIHPRRHVIDGDYSEPLFEDWQADDIFYARLSAGGSYLVVGERRSGGGVRPLVLDAETGRQIELSGFDGLDWEFLDLSRTERWMTYELRDRESIGLFLYELKTGRHCQLRPESALTKLESK